MQNDSINTYDLYNDIKNRTGGEIYIGVLGPVRTGKSTFIKRFMEEKIGRASCRERVSHQV